VVVGLPDNDKGNKTEKASPHRRMEARKKGNVFQSKDLAAGFGLLASFLAFRFFVIGFMYGRFMSLADNFFSLAGTTREMTTDVAMRFIFDLFLNVFLLAAAPLAVALLIGVLMSVSQTRFIFSTEQMKFKLSKLNPIEGFKKMLSLKALVELVKSMLKVAIIVGIAALVLYTKINELPMLVMADINDSVKWMFMTIFDVALFAAIGMIAIGILDFIYQWWEHERQLMMSKQEVRDEYKQLEGDPLIKSRIRNIREKRARERMMADVKDADVVIRNPDHFAVALKYDVGMHATPLVLAKGMDNVALQIIKEAEKHNIMSVENITLARVLYAASEIGREIGENLPEDLMFALADIIFKLYESKNKLQDIEKFTKNNTNNTNNNPVEG